MKSHRIGYAVWLLLTLCLYFFENNTGTRAVLLCSLLFPLIPSLRAAFFSADEPEKTVTAEPLTQKSFFLRESEESGDVRSYLPGDPVKRIHWKLSAKKDELLVRETAAEPEETEEEILKDSSAERRRRKAGIRTAVISAAGILVCVLLLLLIPEANRGAQALCNRLFAASEAVNSYVYEVFPVPEDQNILPAVLFLAGILVFLAVPVLTGHSRVPVFGIAAAYMLFQGYFGLAFPAWIHIPLCGLAALRMMRRPYKRKTLTVFCASVLLVSLLTALALPGVDTATEAASEKARDYLSDAFQKITGTTPEVPDGETETRHIHSRSMENGNREAETEREFRLVTVEEEQVSRPHWVNWMKMILMFAALIGLYELSLLIARVVLARRIKKQNEELMRS